MKPPAAFPTRHIWLAVAGFVAMIVGISAARTRSDRVMYGAVQMGFVLLCLGRAAWLYSNDVARRQEFVFPVYTRYRGPQARGFVYGMRAGAIAFSLMGLGSIALWLTQLWGGHR
jgi:hypothetical protein